MAANNEQIEATEIPNTDGTRVKMEMSVDQAKAVEIALDVYARLCIGQFEAVAHLVNDGTIPRYSEDSSDTRWEPSTKNYHNALHLMLSMKSELGYSVNGSHGIGHGHVHITGHRAWEVRKTISKALAVHRDPNPAFKGVDYDGLIVRYTKDPAPTATVATSGS